MPTSRRPGRCHPSDRPPALRRLEFVEYPLDAQRGRPETMLAFAAFGDGGLWYIPLKRSFAEEGYEPTVAFVSRETEPAYRQAIADLLRR